MPKVVYCGEDVLIQVGNWNNTSLRLEGRWVDEKTTDDFFALGLSDRFSPTKAMKIFILVPFNAWPLRIVSSRYLQEEGI